MNCLKASTLQAFLDGELSPDEKSAVDRHLAECEICASRCRRLQKAIAAFRTDFSKLDPETVEIPECSAILVERQRTSRANHRPGSAHITWLQGLVGVAAAAAIAFAFWPSHRQSPTMDPGLNYLLAQLPPIGEDPQRMWREQSLIITVVDNTDGSVKRFITSVANDRVQCESLRPGHSKIDDSSKLRKGI